MSDLFKRHDVETKDEWLRWCEEIPFIQFPSGWNVKVIPPFAGAVARFRVRDERTPKDDFSSVYLDCYDRLGWVKEPYWEVYPHYDCGGIRRCQMNDTKGLLEMIKESLEVLAEDRTEQGGE